MGRVCCYLHVVFEVCRPQSYTLVLHLGTVCGARCGPSSCRVAPPQSWAAPPSTLQPHTATALPGLPHPSPRPCSPRLTDANGHHCEVHATAGHGVRLTWREGLRRCERRRVGRGRVWVRLPRRPWCTRPVATSAGSMVGRCHIGD